MSKKEKIKIEIDILKAIIILCLTALFGIFGYSVVHYQTIDIVQGISIIAGIAILIFACFLLAKRMYKNLKEIEELE